MKNVVAVAFIMAHRVRFHFWKMLLWIHIYQFKKFRNIFCKIFSIFFREFFRYSFSMCLLGQCLEIIVNFPPFFFKKFFSKSPKFAIFHSFSVIFSIIFKCIFNGIFICICRTVWHDFGTNFQLKISGNSNWKSNTKSSEDRIENRI